MKRYAYKAFQEGKRPVEAVITAENLQTAALRLREKGFRIMRLRPAAVPFFQRRPFRSKKQLALFCREWASLVEAGLPLTDTLGILAAHGRASAGRVLREIVDTIEAGHTLTEAFEESGLFPSFFLAMLSVGEMSGTLPEQLRSLSAYYEKEAAFRKKLAAALGYPLFLLLFSCVLFLLILTIILPSFAQLFHSLGLPLPGVTAMALAAGLWLKLWGLRALGILAVLLAGAALWSRTRDGRAQRDALLLRSDFFRRLVLIRLCHTLSALLRSGSPLSEALLHASRVAGNTAASQKILAMHQDLGKGKIFTESLAASGLCLPVLYHMAAAGMESGELPAFLAHGARLMAEDTEEVLRRMKAILEPALILLVGGVTAAIVCTVVIPLFTAIGRGI